MYAERQRLETSVNTRPRMPEPPKDRKVKTQILPQNFMREQSSGDPIGSDLWPSEM